jgi:hypothetical protein
MREEGGGMREEGGGRDRTLLFVLQSLLLVG